MSIGTLPPGKSVTLVFQTTVASSFPANATQISSSGTVSVSNFSSATAGPAVTPIDIPPSITSAGNVTSQVAILTIIDAMPPIVTVTGSNPTTMQCHTSYTESGATENDSCAGTGLSITTSGSVNTNAVGTYIVSYLAKDPSGNTGTATREVIVNNTISPVITLIGASNTNDCAATYVDPGATAASACGGSLSVTTLYKNNTSLNTLFYFGQGGNIGSDPVADLIQGTDGNFYGTTAAGGADGCGVELGLEFWHEADHRNRDRFV